MPPFRLLACFAHPDDEAFTASGVLAASTARGVEARLVCTTYGEMGDIRQPGAASRDTLGTVRHQELRRSCQVLGLQEPVMLGYRDSGWADDPAQYHPQAFVNAPPQRVIGQLVAEIRRFKPHIVLTFEPEGISGHKDHKAISRYTTAAVRLAGDPTVFPEQDLLPHEPWRLFYTARPQGFRMTRALTLQQAGIKVPWPEPALRGQGTPAANIHVTLDVSPYIEQKLASMRCHQTQIEPEWAFDRVSEDVLIALLGREYLLQAHPKTTPETPPLTDIFTGLTNTGAATDHR